MSPSIVASPSSPDDVVTVGLAFFKSDDGPVSVGDSRGADHAWLKSRGFEAKPGQTLAFKAGDLACVAVGLGEKADLSTDTLRRAGASFVRSALKSASASFDAALAVRDSTIAHDVAAQALAEGVALGAYRFDDYKSKPEPVELESVTLVGADEAGVARGVRIAEAVAMARDLINHPAGTMTPRRLAEAAMEVAESNDLGITVLDEVAIANERLGGLLGVSLGSAEPPRLIELTYEPSDGFESTIALVGKGITFDSGGLSLKPADGMMTMKTDMSGAAAVIATMSTLRMLAPKVKVIGIVCATENLPGPKAIKPGDVLRARNGKTMEVLNTDAEGRLVLADGLSLAVEAGVDAIVDVATLTGACIVALGRDIAGLMSNNDAWREQVQAASDAAGEPTWHLPLPKQYRKLIDSEIADMQNIGASKGAGGTLTAGLFLQEFVDDTPWVHLDIAGPARAESDDAHISKGGTGFGVRTLIELVRNYRKP